MMNILFVTPYLPYPPVSGGRLQTFLRIKHLRQMGHAVYLFSFAEKKDENVIPELKRHVHGCECVYPARDPGKIWDVFRKSLLYEIYTASEEFSSNLRKFTGQRNFDIAVFEGLGVAQYHSSISSIPSVLYEHNVEHEIVSQLVSSLRKTPSGIFRGNYDQMLTNAYLYLWGGTEQKLTHILEAASLKSFDLVIACSENDLNILKQLAPEAASLSIPWCIKMPEEFHLPSKKETYNLTFVGSLQWEPNRDAVEWFAQRIFPMLREELKNIRFLIAGGGPSREVLRFHNNDDIIVLGFVPEISELWLKTDIFVAPMRLGSGVNVKIIEAMSYGLPVITTDKGAEGLDAVPGSEFLRSNTPNEFVQNIRNLISNVEMRRALGAKARQYASEYHDSEHIGSLFEKTLIETAHKIK